MTFIWLLLRLVSIACQKAFTLYTQKHFSKAILLHFVCILNIFYLESLLREVLPRHKLKWLVFFAAWTLTAFKSVLRIRDAALF